MKHIGIVGSRRRNTEEDYDVVQEAFMAEHEEGCRIVSGGCPRGGDRFAEMIAKNHNISITIFKPNWSGGKHAGLLRNTDIARHSDVLIACVAKDRKGGTEDTIKKFEKFHPHGKVVLV